MKHIVATLAVLLIFLNTTAQDSLNIGLIYHWSDSTLPASQAYNNTYNETWGFVQGGREYGVIGSTMGTHIFDVTDPYNAVQVDFVPGKVQGVSIVHRDFHDYNGHMYIVADEGASSLQIVDLNYLPDSVELVYDSNSLLAKAHNIFIDTANAKMYQCGGNGNSGLTVFDLTNPANPVEVYDYNCGYVHDVYVINDTVYANQGNSGLFVYDFTTTTNPQLIGSLTSYVQQGYNHSGWRNDDGIVYALADETHGMDIKLLDVSDLGNITLLDTIGSEVHPLSIPHNLIFRGSFLYVSYYYDGLYVFDCADPQNPFVAGYYDTSTIPNAPSYKGAWGVYPDLPSGIVLISDMQNGFYILDVSSITVNSDQEEQLPDHELAIFPNPVVDHFTISISQFANSSLNQWQLLDYTGKLIEGGPITQSLTPVRLSSTLANGIYLVKISGNNKTLIKKLICNR